MKIRIEQSELKRKASIRELMKAQNGDIETIVLIMSRFCKADDGAEIPADQAREMILDMTVEDFERATRAMMTGLADAAVPPLNAAQSS